MKRLTLAAGIAVLLGLSAFGFDTRTTPDATDGTRAVVDIPKDQHIMNVGGSDGAGLCVYTSVELGARWQNAAGALGLRKFAEGRPGGSYPEKLESDLKTFAARNKITLPPYVQHTGGDDAFLDLCFATRRSPGITYAGFDGFYDAGVAHMVSGAHLDARLGAIIDNNRPGSWVWMTRKQLLNRWKGKKDDGSDILVPVRDGFRTVWYPVGGGWAFVWLTPPPPPKAPTIAEQNEEKKAVPVTFWERRVLDDRPYWLLYVDGELKYVIDPEGKWHVALSETSYDPAPIEKPDDVMPPEAPEPMANWNNGIAVEKLSRCHRYWINGEECSRAKAFAAVGDPGGLLDDSDKYHLSIIGDKATIAALFLPGGRLERFARRVHVQVYSASDWVAKDRLISVVTLQEPAKIGGKVVGSSADVGNTEKVLSDVFDPVSPPKPEPKPPVDPKPPIAPSPLTLPQWLQIFLAALAAWLGVKLVKGRP